MTLTVALTIAGVLLIAGVLIHGVWQARRAGAKRGAGDSALPSRLDPPRLEPNLDDDRLPHSELMPLSDATPPADGGAEPRPARLRAQNRLDALVDAIVTLRLDAPLPAETLLAHLPAAFRAGSKPFLIEGLDEASGEWGPLQPGRRYRECQAGVLLANRGGALNEIEWSEFVQKIERFAEGIGATADFPDMLEVVARAKELDAFAGAHDAQLAVVLRARGAAWSIGYLHQHAASAGFVPGAVPGRLIRPSADDGAPPVLALAYDPQAAYAEDPNQATLRQVALSFDVPQTEAAADPFGAWRQASHELAAALEAEVVDDSGRPLPDASFEMIGTELGRLYAALQQRDLAAGSPATRRLFS